MKEIKADYWIVEENKVKLQIKTTEQQTDLQDILPGWKCVSYGFVPKTMEDIYVFEKQFDKQKDLARFVNSGMINEQIKIREVTND